MGSTSRLFAALAIYVLALLSADAQSLPMSGNLVGHFDAASVTGIANNGPIASWTDSVSGIVSAQSTGGNQPTFTTNRMNRLPSVRFSGSQWLSFANASAGALGTAIDSGEYTVFIVFKTLGSSGGVLFSASVGNSSFYFQADGTSVSFNQFFGHLIVPYTATNYSTLGLSAWTGGTVTPPYSNSGTLQSLYVNGGAVGTNGIMPNGSGGNPYVIGAQTVGGATAANVEIFDIIVYNVHFTPPQYMQLQAWADNKYGQAHPWAGKPFTIFFGDSITQGVDGTGATNAYPYLTAQALGLSYGQWSNIGVGGITTVNMSLLAPTMVDPLPSQLGQYVNLVSFEWYNDFLNGKPSFTDGQTYIAARKAVTGIRAVWGTSTGFSGDPNTTRNADNASWDASIPNANIDSYVPIHHSAQIGSSTAYVNFPANFDPDGIHPSNAGYAVLAPLFTAGIQALPALPSTGCPQSVAFIATTTGTLSAAETVMYQTIICRSQAAGVGCHFVAGDGQPLNRLYVFATNNTHNAYLDLCGHGGATANGTITLQPDRYVFGDASTGYLDTGFNAATATDTQFTRNSASYGVCSTYATGAGNYIDIGVNNSRMSYALFAAGLSVGINSGDNQQAYTQTNPQPGVGFVAVSRTNSTGFVSTINNQPFYSNAASSSQVPASFNFYIMAANSSGTAVNKSADRIATAFIGGGLTASQSATLVNIIDAGLWANGVPGCGPRLTNPAVNRSTPLGMNAEVGACFFCGIFPFLDQFKASNAVAAYGNTSAGYKVGWATVVSAGGNVNSTGEENRLQLDASGWPTTLTPTAGPGVTYTVVGVNIFNSSYAVPTGAYHVIFDGAGTIKVEGDFGTQTITTSGQTFTQGTSPTTNVTVLYITQTDPLSVGNYIRNIHVVLDSQLALFNSGEIWNPAYVNFLKPFSPLRFMDAMNTNGNPATNNQGIWADRPMLTDAFWSTQAGVPMEALIALANEVGADMYLPVPIGQDRDPTWNTNMAALVHSLLKPGLRVYLPLSNEAWNFQFPQAGYAQNAGCILWSISPCTFNPQGVSYQWFGMETALTCQAWKGVWATFGDSSRIVCILGTQYGISPSASLGLQCPLWVGNPCGANYGIDAIEMASYSGVVPTYDWFIQPDGGLNKLFDNLMSVDIPLLGNTTQGDVNYFAKYWLDVVGYESGPSFIVINDTITASISGTTMTVTANNQNQVYVGGTISGAGVTNGTIVTAYGTASGGNGTYTVSPSQTVGSEAMTSIPTSLINLYLAANSDSRMIIANQEHYQTQRQNGMRAINYFNDIGPTNIYSGLWSLTQSIFTTTTPKVTGATNYATSPDCFTANQTTGNLCVGAHRFWDEDMARQMMLGAANDNLSYLRIMGW